MYLGFARERVKCFLISNASAANITLSHGQHVARELGIHRVYTKAFTAVTAITLGSRVGCINFVECLGACETVTCLSTCYCADASVFITSTNRIKNISRI